MLLTYADLVKKEACAEWLEIFKERRPNGLRLETLKDRVAALRDGFGPVAGWLREKFRLPPWDLAGADLRGADLREADLYGADLSKADLSGADLNRANFYGANLSRADLRGADLTGANLRRANLGGVDLEGRPLCPKHLTALKRRRGR